MQCTRGNRLFLPGWYETNPFFILFSLVQKALYKPLDGHCQGHTYHLLSPSICPSLHTVSAIHICRGTMQFEKLSNERLANSIFQRLYNLNTIRTEYYTISIPWACPCCLYIYVSYNMLHRNCIKYTKAIIAYNNIFYAQLGSTDQVPCS